MTSPPPKATCRIFFSYARADGMWLVRRLMQEVQTLADGKGISVELWWDKGEREALENIAPGERFMDVIYDAIDDCSFMIFLLSPKSVRFGGVCLMELQHAQARPAPAGPVPILPVVADVRYRDVVTPGRADHEKLEALRELETIDYEDFSECWGTLPGGGRPTDPPDEWNDEHEHWFLEGWRKLKPQIEFGLRGKPFNRRERTIVDDAHACEAAFLRNEAERLKARPAVWAEIERRSSGEGGLIVHGDAGIGKTSLLQWIQREHDSRIAAVWRCDREIPATWDAWRFVHAIAVQLAACLPDYYKATKDSPEVKALVLRGDAAQEDPAGIFHRAVVLPLLAIEPPSEPMYVLVDGLDEAAETLGDELKVPALLHIRHADLPRWLRVVATAQSAYVDVHPEFHSWNDLRLDANDEVHRADLRAFVLSSFEEPSLAELLRRAHVEPEQAADGVMATANGSFLVAFWLLKTVRTMWRAGRDGAPTAEDAETIDPAAFRRMIANPPPIGDYVIKRLRRQFGDPTASEWRAASRFLAVLVSAKRALTDDELETLAALEAPHLAQIKRRLEGILKSVDGQKTDFFHNGVRKWLQQASDYQIHEQEGHRGIVEAVERELGNGRSLQAPYLKEFGLQHLILVGRVDVAVDVLASFLEEERKKKSELGLTQMVKNVFQKLEQIRETDSEVISKIDPDRLAEIMRRGCGEIPALYGPARVLFDRHLDRWPELREELIGADDLLVRHTLGRAAADVYLATKDKTRRATLWREIESCFRLEPPDDEDAREAAYNLRQWARYAWRFLMPQPDVDRAVRKEFAAGMTALSESDDYNDQMILWECLLEGALQGELLPGALPKEGVDARFWRARWPYLWCDLLEYEAQCRLYGDSAADRIVAAFDAPDGVAVRLDEEANAVLARLDEAEKALAELANDYEADSPLGSPLEAWQRPSELNLRLQRTTDSLLPLPLEEIQRYLTPFVLHPCWDVVETAASVAAFLAELRSDIPILIVHWATSPHWQARYAAVDTCFGTRATLVDDRAIPVVQELTQDVELRRALAERRTGEQVFDILVDALYDDPVSRVQFIVAEDLFYLFDDYEKMYLGTAFARGAAEQERHGFRLALARREKYLKRWLRSAADCTLLDEVFQFVNDLATKKSPGVKAAWPLMRQWLDEPVSPYLAVQDEWWLLDRETWLQRMAAVRI